MAIQPGIFAGTQEKWGFAEESTFGTAVADTGNFEMQEGPMPSVNHGVVTDRTVKFDGTRMFSTANQYTTTTGQPQIISFDGVIPRRTDLCNYFAACMQGVTEGTASPYTKTFTWTYTKIQPGFSSNQGKFYTIGFYGPIASYMRKYTSCILRSLTVKKGGDGRLNLAGEWFSGFAPVTTANFNTGTWAFNTQNYYNMNALSSKQIATNDIVLYDFSITFNNQVAIVGANSSGYAEGYALACNDTGYDATGSLTMKYDANTQTLLADSLAGTGRKLQIATGTAGQAGHFDVTLYACLFDAVDKDYGMDVGQAIKVNFKAGYDGSNGLALVTISDGVDQTWVDF